MRAVGRTRIRWRLVPDEALIFLALGQLGLSNTSVGLTIKPVFCHDIADLLKIPKETVRRKVSRLVDLELAAPTIGGVLIKNVDEWRRLAESIGDDVFRTVGEQ